jgi:gliding motility-associated-like protein
MWSAEKTITVWPKPNAYFRPLPDRVRIPGQKVTFANFSTNADNLQWDFGDGSTSPEYEPVHQYTQTGFYDIQLAIESANGCQDTMTLVKGVEAYSEGELNVPNAFMPDKSGPSGGIYVPGDPHNHIFYPTVAAGDLEIYELQIFNRWGNLLFESREPERGWDGYYNDKLCPQDVYVWRIKCRFVNGIEIVKTGDVTLLR